LMIPKARKHESTKAWEIGAVGEISVGRALVKQKFTR
jgi:hypothetical protein